jgi:hypothetical protein
MLDLRLHLELYASAAIDRAIAVYAGHAQIARTDEAAHAVLRIESPRAGRAALVARELGNYALGLTIQERGDVAQGRGGAGR